MAYKRILPRLIELDELTGICGLFNSETKLNNGYGCHSKSKYKQEPGCCYSFDCPLASAASLSDLKILDKDLYEEHLENFEDGESKDDCSPSSSYGSNWMVQYYELVCSA